MENVCDFKKELVSILMEHTEFYFIDGFKGLYDIGNMKIYFNGDIPLYSACFIQETIEKLMKNDEYGDYFSANPYVKNGYIYIDIEFNN